MSRFLLEFFLSHSTENIRRGTLLCFRIVLESKTSWIIGVSRFFFECFLYHSTEIFAGEPFFSLISGVENFKHRKRVSRSSVEHILSHITKFIRMGTLLWIRKFLFSKIFLDKKDLEGGGEYQKFLSFIFCLTVPKRFAGNHLVFHKFRVSKKNKQNRGISRFYVETILPRSTKSW